MTSYWRDDAACRLADARLFDEVDGNRAGVHHRIHRAILICNSCPVATRCLVEARTNRDSGVRGGLLLDHGKPRRIPDDRPYNTTVRAA